MVDIDKAALAPLRAARSRATTAAYEAAVIDRAAFDRLFHAPEVEAADLALATDAVAALRADAPKDEVRAAHGLLAAVSKEVRAAPLLAAAERAVEAGAIDEATFHALTDERAGYTALAALKRVADTLRAHAQQVKALGGAADAIEAKRALLAPIEAELRKIGPGPVGLLDTAFGDKVALGLERADGGPARRNSLLVAGAFAGGAAILAAIGVAVTSIAGPLLLMGAAAEAIFAAAHVAQAASLPRIDVAVRP